MDSDAVGSRSDRDPVASVDRPLDSSQSLPAFPQIVNPRPGESGFRPSSGILRHVDTVYVDTVDYSAKRSQQHELNKGITAVRTTAKGKTQPTHQIDEDTVSVVFPQSDKGGVKIALEVAGSQIPMEVDTRATAMVIPISGYEQYLSHVQLHTSTVTLKTYSGGSLKVKRERQQYQ